MLVSTACLKHEAFMMKAQLKIHNVLSYNFYRKSFIHQLNAFYWHSGPDLNVNLNEK